MLARIRIVMIETFHPGNIGSAARAMKTMGLSQLHLVAPKQYPDQHARQMASSADDVLDSAQVHQKLEHALCGTVRAFALTARPRDLAHPPLTPRQAAEQILVWAAQGDVALVFGNETYGLTNEQVLACQEVVHIPANPAYTSLNLAAAVQILCYECRQAYPAQPTSQPVLARKPATHDAVRGLLMHWQEALNHIGFLDLQHPKRLLPRLQRLVARMRVEDEEVSILRGVAKQMLTCTPPAWRVEKLRQQMAVVPSNETQALESPSEPRT